MKKLILLLSIITICYACKKQPTSPSTTLVQNNIQIPLCGPLGDCYSGTYVFDSLKTMDPKFNATGTDTIIPGLTIHVLYNGDTIINNNTFIKYKLDSITCSLQYLNPLFISGFNKLIWLKNSTYNNDVVLQTKTQKSFVCFKI